MSLKFRVGDVAPWPSAPMPSPLQEWAGREGWALPWPGAPASPLAWGQCAGSCSAPPPSLRSGRTASAVREALAGLGGERLSREFSACAGEALVAARQLAWCGCAAGRQSPVVAALPALPLPLPRRPVWCSPRWPAYHVRPRAAFVACLPCLSLFLRRTSPFC